MEKILDCFSKALVLSKLTHNDQLELLKLAVKKRVARGQVICWQGDLWPYVVFIVKGKLEWTMLSSEGRRQVVFGLDPCQVVWGHTCLDGLPMPANLEAAEDTEILLWPGELISPLVSHSIEATWDVSRLLLSYMRHVREMVYGFAFQQVAGRLAALLLAYYKPQHGHKTSRDMTLDQMADNIGTTRELVSRTLHRFANEGLIKINRVEIVFTDPGGLEEVATK